MRQRRTHETDPYLMETDDEDDDDDEDNSSSSSEYRKFNWKVLTGTFIIQVCSCTSEVQNVTSYITRKNIQSIDFVFGVFSCSQ